MENYKDMIKKTKYYKEHIINNYIKKGYFPTTKDINTKLELIETRTALCESYLSKPGSLFNTKEFNYMFEMIYKDLEILYETIYEILLEEYSQLKMYIEAHLNELESKSELFYKRLNEEMASSSIGKLLFFKSNDWNIDTDDTVTIIDLGNIELNQAAKIALFANINNVNNNSVSFKLISENKKMSFDALPYNYNNDTYIVPGTKKIIESELNLNGRVIVNDKIEINMPVNPNNSYKILGGKNKMIVTYSNGDIRVENFATITNTFVATQDCIIEFYCYNNPTIQYNFNIRPLYCNFPISDSFINTKDTDIKKISLKAQKGFVCYFIVDDGDIYASSEDGIIVSNDSISYNGNWDLRDFKILEYENEANKIKYNIKLMIDSDKDIIPNIDNISIRQIG